MTAAQTPGLTDCGEGRPDVSEMPDSAAQAPPRAEKQEMKNEASKMLDLPPALEARASDCKTTAECGRNYCRLYNSLRSIES